MQQGATFIERLIRAGLLIVVLAIALAAAPQAIAHGLAHAESGATQAARGTTLGIQSASSALAGRDDSCPTDSDDGHAAHIGCCGSLASCSAGCGAALAPEEAPQFFAPKVELISSLAPPSPGIGTIPADPPPRATI